MSILNQFEKTYSEYTNMKNFLVKRARIKSEASYTESEEYKNRIIQNGDLNDISFSEYGIWLDFVEHRDGYNDEYVTLSAEELEMSDNSFETHIKEEFSHILRERENKKRREENEIKKKELEMLKRLQEKYA